MDGLKKELRSFFHECGATIRAFGPPIASCPACGRPGEWFAAPPAVEAPDEGHRDEERE